MGISVVGRRQSTARSGHLGPASTVSLIDVFTVCWWGYLSKFCICMNDFVSHSGAYRIETGGRTRHTRAGGNGLDAG